MAKLIYSHANEYGVLWTLAVEEQFYLIWPRHAAPSRRYYEQLFLGRKRQLAPYVGATVEIESLP